MSDADEPLFVPTHDSETLQATVLAAAIAGDEACRGQLSFLHAGFEEPYRTLAVTVVEMLRSNSFIDPHTVVAALASRRLTRKTAGGAMETLTPDKALDLVCAAAPQPGQAVAYAQLLHERLDAKRQVEFKEQVLALAQQYGDSPARLMRELDSLAREAQKVAGLSTSGSRPESLKFLPYFGQLLQAQQGTDFLGLDSGFRYFNQICNGLHTGLIVIAAKPSEGKTTLVWQICDQAAAINKMPVIYVSMEQSEGELRTKSLARRARINTRHLARGRFRPGDQETLQRLQQAAEEYFRVGRYLTIIEGDDTTTIDVIGDLAVAQMARCGQRRCLIAIDYLQILPLAREDTGRITSPKDRVDLHITALRRLARRLDSPIIVISSQNRAGYNSTQMNVFKETGGIEYGSDIAAILKCDKEGTKSANGAFRVMNLSIIKNRNGELGLIKLKFYPEYAEFVEKEKTVLPEQEESKG